MKRSSTLQLCLTAFFIGDPKVSYPQAGDDRATDAAVSNTRAIRFWPFFTTGVVFFKRGGFSLDFRGGFFFNPF